MLACAPPSAPSARDVSSFEATPDLEAIQEQVVGALVRLRAVPGDLELHVERQQLEVRLGQVADQRQPHAAPGVLGGQEVRPRRLVRATDAPPDVELPRRGERAEEEVASCRAPAGRAARAGTACDADSAPRRRCSRADGKNSDRATPSLGAGLLHARGGDPHVVVVARAPPGSGPSGWGPGTPPTRAASASEAASAVGLAAERRGSATGGRL